MADKGRPSLAERLSGRFRSRERPHRRDVQRMEEKRRSLTAATQEWLSLLRDMEQAGQTGDAKYETYFQAYLQAKQQQKRVDLELFNLRNGLNG